MAKIYKDIKVKKYRRLGIKVILSQNVADPTDFDVSWVRL